MTHFTPRTAALAASAVLLGAVMPLAMGSAARAADPPTPRSTPSQNTTYHREDDKFSLTVSPTRVAVDPEQLSKTQKILLVNRGHAPLAITVQKRNFTGGADGTLVFAEKAPYSASEWVTVDNPSFTIAPGSSHTLGVTIDVPANPEPGDHQVALVFMVPAVRSDANISINRGIGTPFYIQVPGPSDDSVSLSRLDAPAFSAGGTVDVSARLRNTGTVHRDFRGDTALKLGAAGDPARFPDFTVIRGAVRDVRTTWNPPLLCICQVKVAFDNADGAPQSATVRVIVFPVKLAAIALAVLIVVIALFVWRRRRYAAAVQAAAERLTVAAGV